MSDDGINIQTVDAQGKSSLNYETVFNLHVIRTNQLMQNLTSQKGVGIFVIMSLFASISNLDGLIRNNRNSPEYNKRVDLEFENIEKKFKILGDVSTDDQKFIDTWFLLLKTYNYQLQQMNRLGLTPAEDEDDFIPTVVEKINTVIVVPQWKPTEKAFDYRKELGLSDKPEKFKQFLQEIEDAKKEMNSRDDTEHSLPA